MHNEIGEIINMIKNDKSINKNININININNNAEEIIKLLFSDNKKILMELMDKQLKNIPIERKLQFKDLKRIAKYINSSIFGNNCSLWQGYVTNESNIKRGTYVNFFFRNKKVALHRLLYENYVDALGDEHYLKFTCDCSTSGKCCNVTHMTKHAYNSKDEYIKINEYDACTVQLEKIKKNRDKKPENITGNFNVSFD